MTLYNAQNQPIPPSQSKEQPPGFQAVDGNTPIPDGHARFRIGERLPWKGLVFELRRFSGNQLLLEVVDTTAGSKRDLKRKSRPRRGKAGKRNHRTGASARRGKGQ